MIPLRGAGRAVRGTLGSFTEQSLSRNLSVTFLLPLLSQPPREPRPWDGELQATRNGASCMQVRDKKFKVRIPYRV